MFRTVFHVLFALAAVNSLRVPFSRVPQRLSSAVTPLKPLVELARATERGSRRGGGCALVLSAASTAAMEDEEVGELLGGWKDGRPLKVAIAGGGVGGLTTALAMLKRGKWPFFLFFSFYFFLFLEHFF